MKKVLLILIFATRLAAADVYLYTNGLWTSFDKGRLTAEHYSREYFDAPCAFLYNPEVGRVRDVTRAILCWCGKEHPAVSRHVAFVLDAVSRLEPSERLIWIVHSEGALVADQALDRLSAEARSRIHLYTFGAPRAINKNKAALVANYAVQGDPITFFAGAKWGWPSRAKHRILDGRYDRALGDIFGSKLPVPSSALPEHYVTQVDLFLYRGADETSLGLEPIGSGPHVPTSVESFHRAPQSWTDCDVYRQRHGDGALYTLLDVIDVVPAGTPLKLKEVRTVHPAGMGTVHIPLVAIGDKDELVNARFLFEGGVGDGMSLFAVEDLIGEKTLDRQGNVNRM